MCLSLYSSNNRSSKDALCNAPSSNSAQNYANCFNFNNGVITGIAAAVSVFLFIIISIIAYGVIIRSFIIISESAVIIITVSMYISAVMCPKSLNTNAKPCSMRN